MVVHQMLTTTITALMLASTAASATGIPGPDAVNGTFERFVQTEVSCFDGHASVAIRTRDSIEHVSFAPIQVRVGADSKPSPITCGESGYSLGGEKLTNIALATYALATLDAAKAARVSDSGAISFDVRGGKDKGTWNLASTVGFPVTSGMTSVKHGKCQFDAGPVSSTLDLDVGSGTTVQMVPVQKYPNGVLTLIEIIETSGMPDEESTVLKWESGGEQHACVANQGNYSTHRKITTLLLEYGKAAHVTLSDQSVFEITASAGWPG